MIVSFFGGEIELTFKSFEKVRVFEYLSRSDIPFSDLVSCGEEFSLYVPYYRKRRILKDLKRAGIEAFSGRVRGFPSLFHRYRKRVCIPIGIVVSAIMIWYSGKVIWTVNVEGNSTVPDSEIISILESLGCGVGDRYEDIDFDILHNRFLMECEDIAWIAVNMNGTHANVEVREVIEGREEDEDGFYNIVASEDGQIEMVAATEGKPVVERFDTVVKGELLISGAISYKSDTMSRFESADGSVYARVRRSFDVKVPVKKEVKEYTGEEIKKITVRFFKLNINLFRNSRIPYEFCDTITVSNQIYLFESVALPVYIDKRVYKEYKPSWEVMSAREAEKAAIAKYKEQLLEVLGDASIIEKTVAENFDGESYTISCSLYCLADIAKKVPLELTKDDKTENKDKETEKYGTENSQYTQ